MSEPSPAPIPPAPHVPRHPLRGIFAMRAVGRRWPYAIRTAVCMGIPVAIGYGVGDLASGLMATIGGFTALYGSGRPFLNRAMHLAVVAVAFAVSIGLGILAGPYAWASVLVVAAIASSATLFCQVLGVAPPGAYMFALATGIGVGLAAEHLSAERSALLVLGGGAIAWVVHMSGALIRPRGPEVVAVRDAAHAVAAFIEAIGTPQQDAARHAAAIALEQSWAVLITYQPVRTRSESTLDQLRVLARELHVLFAEAMDCAAKNQPVADDVCERARGIGRRAAETTERNSVSEVTRAGTPADTPLGRPGGAMLLARSLTLGSPAVAVTLRVACATVIAGAVGAVMGLDHAYWAMAAAVLVLYQGADFVRTTERGLERVLGTGVGLLVAGALLHVDPRGLWLVVTIIALQFVIDLLVVRNYALAVVFITPIALLIGTGGRSVDDIGRLLGTRALDTVIGCAVAVAVYAATLRRHVARRVPDSLVAVLDATGRALEQMSTQSVTSPAARRARRDLQQQLLALDRSYAADVGSSLRSRDTAEWLWPSVVAAQRVGYRTLSVCWGLEQLGDSAAAAEAARSMFGTDGLAELCRSLDAIAVGIRNNTVPVDIGPLPSFLGTEVRTLAHSVPRRPDRA